MLAYVFEQFPLAFYLAISLPTTVPEFPLLAHFSHIEPQQGKYPSHELYVFHKYALAHCVKVSKLEVCV